MVRVGSLASYTEASASDRTGVAMIEEKEERVEASVVKKNTESSRRPRCSLGQ